MNQRPKSGELYRHFKDKLYQIVTIAKHSETGEELVIYQALYGEYKCCARPLTMFMSEVDHEKYPNVKQKYRFEKVEITQQHENIVDVEQEQTSIESKKDSISENIVVKKEEANRTNRSFYKKYQESYKKQPQITPVKLESLTIEEKMMAFFDAEDLEERYKILLTMSKEITDTMIDNMAVVMDVVIEDGEITKRYDDLKYAIQTKQRYEQMVRLR